MYSKVILFNSKDYFSSELKKKVKENVDFLQDENWRFVSLSAGSKYIAILYTHEEETPVTLDSLTAIELFSTDDYSESELQNFINDSIKIHEDENWRLTAIQIGAGNIFLTFNKISVKEDEEATDYD